MFLVHLWLPKAHVEAPTVGSMILAGVTLKLGRYALLRLFINTRRIRLKLNWLCISIRLVGNLFLCFVCLRQVDLKSLIAYSSVIHMGLCLLTIFFVLNWSYEGGLWLSLSHGLASSGLFFLTNRTYLRFNSRRLYINKGLACSLPVIRLWWFLLLIFNMASPPSLNLFREIKMVTTTISISNFILIMSVISRFFCAAYCLFLFRNIYHGKHNNTQKSSNTIIISEHFISFYHLWPLCISITLLYFLQWIKYLLSLKKILICGIKDLQWIINIIISIVLLSTSSLTIRYLYNIVNYKSVFFNSLLFFSINSYNDLVSNSTDQLSLIFISIVLIIRGFTFLYTSWYVGNRKIFSILVLLFVCRMLLLINFTNLWIFIWGWDFLGVVSYILVINYQNQNSSNAGMITVLSNRVGDSFMIIRVSLLTLTGNWNSIINNNQNYNIIILLIILTRITKSAQIPFCAWLPAAMAAPTPVSALVHSSTLVTAGVYLIIRFNQNNPSIITLLIGIVTTILAGINACNGFDFKKLIALSTLSQLGLMFIALGLGNYKLALYHLVTHGLVKALLFLSAGLVIHQTKSNQDLRLITGLMQTLPLTGTCIILTSLTLSGLPFMTCFFSKEVIINQNFIKSIWIIIRIYIAARLTINYSLRLIHRVYKSPSAWNTNNFTEKNINTLIPLLGLLPFSILWGASNFWFFIPVVQSYIQFNITFTILTWTIIVFSIYLGYTLYSNKTWGKSTINRLITNLLFLPSLRSNFINSSINLGFKIIKNIETSWSESLGAQGTYNILTKVMLNNRISFITVYTLRILFWLLLVICLSSL